MNRSHSSYRSARETRPPRVAVPVRSLKPAPNLFIAHTQPGLESIALAELTARVKNVAELGRRTVADRNGMLIFSTTDLAGLRRLRTAEDLFAIVSYERALNPERAGLEQARKVAALAPYVDEALRARVRLLPGSRAGRRLSFRVITRASGLQDFRRVDLQRALERGIAERGDHAWRLSPDQAEVEFWATLLDQELILAIRLSDESMRHRDYKQLHVPGSLRPSVAAAMAWLSEPADDDVVLDPMCGAGTILIERAQLGRYKLLLGGDSEPRTLEAARENIGVRFKPIELRLWDAVAMPLEASSVDKLITNLPWGRKIGSHSDNRHLYPRLFAEFDRVLREDGSMVLMTAESRLMRDLMARRILMPQKIFQATVLGARTEIYVCRKQGVSRRPAN